MGLLTNTWGYFSTHQAEFWAKTATHLRLSGLALLAGVCIGFLLGMLAAQNPRSSPFVTNILGSLRAVPSLAIMAVMLPVIGIGFRPAVIALAILAIPPVLINTQAGLSGVDPAVLEAARGMGLSRPEILWQVQLPLALPVVLAGVRTSAVEVLSSATIGAIIGAGGLGEYIFAGLSLGPAYLHLMLVGAIAVAALTLAVEELLSAAEALARHAAGRSSLSGGSS